MSSRISGPRYYTNSLDGHRAAYLDFFKVKLGGQRITARRIFWTRSPVLFLMIEENFTLYLAAAFWRSILNRRTVGLLFRPRPALEGKTLRLRLKRIALSLARRLPNLHTISIVPANLDPRIARITDNWIYDPQLWDLTPSNRQIALSNGPNFQDVNSEWSDICHSVRLFTDARPVLIALGMQNHAKGVDLLAEQIDQGATAGWAVVVAGKFGKDSLRSKELITANGGLVFDRYLSDGEMLALYGQANAIWANYDPSYDQASGILGRAAQLGVPVVVRSGSLSEALCRAEGICYRDGDDLAASLSSMPQRQPDLGVRQSDRFEERSVAILQNALGMVGSSAR